VAEPRWALVAAAPLAVLPGQWCPVCRRTADAGHRHEPCWTCGELLPTDAAHFCPSWGTDR
jgi:hypothetical protein